MDDTKKIIERYKRELMEMSRASGSVKPAANTGRSEEKKPRVIGFVSGESKVYDNFLEELGKMPDLGSAEPSTAVKTSENNVSGIVKTPDKPNVIVEKAAQPEDCPADNTGDVPYVIVEEAAQPEDCPADNTGDVPCVKVEEAAQPEDCPADNTGDVPCVIVEEAAQPEDCPADNTEDVPCVKVEEAAQPEDCPADNTENVPDVIVEEAAKSERRPENDTSCKAQSATDNCLNSTDFEISCADKAEFTRDAGNSRKQPTSEFYASAEDEAAARLGQTEGLHGSRIADLNQPDSQIADLNQPLFSQPSYIYIPSTEQVRTDITEENIPANNTVEKNVSGVTNNFTNTPRPEQAPVGVASIEQAERLGNQPVSGTDPNEQLTGRSFEDIAGNSQIANSNQSDSRIADLNQPDSRIANPNQWQGSRGKPANFPRSKFIDYEDYQKQNPGKGSIIFRVYTGRQALPLENAECIIYTRINGERYEIAKLFTNSSGQTPIQALPAPYKELSQHYENEIQSFSLYDAKVTKSGFSQVILEDIPIFDGVLSIQKVFMIVN